MARARHEREGLMQLPFHWHVRFAAKDQPRTWLWISSSPVICAKRISTALWHEGQERVSGGESFSSDREQTRGSIEFKLHAKRPAKAGIYEACKNEHFPSSRLPPPCS
jgi:hypothetical protein